MTWPSRSCWPPGWHAGISARPSPDLRAAVGEARYRERRWELLALGLCRTGRQVQALAELRRVRDLLATEIGIEPGRDCAHCNSACSHTIPTSPPTVRRYCCEPGDSEPNGLQRPEPLPVRGADGVMW
ncbi:BTAD domain-containing putative transcriptional regulator [Nocardia arthritidis]|uniref:BTAD domain-containing putative transcriptional regulator n=1 Tax=Nocardia arthritidis TaxID=228602 RepID=UPI00142D513C